MRKILVIGGTGAIGTPLIQHLKDDGADFAALVRNAGKAKLLQDQGIFTVQGDLSDPASLENAFRGCSHLFLLSPVSPEQVTLQGNAIKAAKKAGIQHIVKVSAIGTAPDALVQLARWHAETEEQIRQSGMAYTFLHPNFFTQNLFMHLESIRKEGTIYTPRKGRASMIDVRDIGAFAAKVLTEDGHAGKTYILTGPEAVSMEEAAGAIGAATGKKINVVAVDFDTARKAMLGMGLPEWLADDLIRLAEVFNNGWAEAVAPAFEKIMGRKAISVEQFARDFKAMFR